MYVYFRQLNFSALAENGLRQFFGASNWQTIFAFLNKMSTTRKSILKKEGNNLWEARTLGKIQWAPRARSASGNEANIVNKFTKSNGIRWHREPVQWTSYDNMVRFLPSQNEPHVHGNFSNYPEKSGWQTEKEHKQGLANLARRRGEGTLPPDENAVRKEGNYNRTYRFRIAERASATPNRYDPVRVAELTKKPTVTIPLPRPTRYGEESRNMVSSRGLHTLPPPLSPTMTRLATISRARALGESRPGFNMYKLSPLAKMARIAASTDLSKIRTMSLPKKTRKRTHKRR